MFEFKKGGYLKGSKPIVASMEDIMFFVNTPVRRKLYSELEIFIFKLQLVCNQEVIVWIDGSFVTRKRYPKDIDLVIFVTNVDLKDNQRVFYDLEEFARISSYLDVYIVPVYPITERAFITDTKKQKAYWYKLFRSIKGRRLLKKAFVELRL